MRALLHGSEACNMLLLLSVPTDCQKVVCGCRMSLEAFDTGSDYNDGGLVGVMELQRNKKEAAHKAAAKTATTNAMTKAAVGTKPGRTPEHYCHQKEMAARVRAREPAGGSLKKAQNVWSCESFSAMQ